jgi:hypothetical protein
MIDNLGNEIKMHRIISSHYREPLDWFVNRSEYATLNVYESNVSILEMPEEDWLLLNDSVQIGLLNYCDGLVDGYEMARDE